MIKLIALFAMFVLSVGCAGTLDNVQPSAPIYQANPAPTFQDVQHACADISAHRTRRVHETHYIRPGFRVSCH